MLEFIDFLITLTMFGGDGRKGKRRARELSEPLKARQCAQRLLNVYLRSASTRADLRATKVRVSTEYSYTITHRFKVIRSLNEKPTRYQIDVAEVRNKETGELVEMKAGLYKKAGPFRRRGNPADLPKLFAY